MTNAYASMHGRSLESMLDVNVTGTADRLRRGRRVNNTVAASRDQASVSLERRQTSSGRRPQAPRQQYCGS
jgi:hypothetical protein